MPEIKYNYVNRKRVNLFMSGGFGLNYLRNTSGEYSDIIENRNGFGFGLQVWFLGLEIKPVENVVIRLNTLGYGTLGIMEFGLGYRF
jgi:opacity protein-like surface antigen